VDAREQLRVAYMMLSDVGMEVFDKLGISSRKQLRSALSDVGQPSFAHSRSQRPRDQVDGDRRR
jgi:hypothetical protein